MVGKVRVMIACLAVTILAMLVSGLATDFTVLLVARIVAGIAGGGIFPVGIAVIGDLVPVKERQVAIGRWLTAVITGNLIGSSLAGVVGDLLGWRGVFFVITALGVVALGVAIVSLREAARAKPRGPEPLGLHRRLRQGVRQSARESLLRAVFVEGIVIFGLFPFVALLLLAAGEPRASIAGLVIAGFSVGGVIYALLVPRLVARWRPDQLMIGGGVIAAFSLGDRGVRFRLAGAACRLHAARLRLLHAARLDPGAGDRALRRPRAAPRCRCTRSSSSSGMRAARCCTGSASSGSARAVTISIAAADHHGGRLRVRAAAAGEGRGLAG